MRQKKIATTAVAATLAATTAFGAVPAFAADADVADANVGTETSDKNVSLDSGKGGLREGEKDRRNYKI